jgi:hypothetical protein
VNTGFEVSTGWLGVALATSALVLLVGAIAIRRSAWGHRSGQRWRLALFALACLAGFLLATRPRLLPVSPEDVGILVTPGAPEGELAEGLSARRFALADVRLLPAASESLTANLSERLASRRLGPWSELATSGPGAWRVLGNGLRAFELEHWPAGVGLAVDPPGTPSQRSAGVVELRWPRTIQLGQRLLVEGRFDARGMADAGVLRLMGPGGMEGEVALGSGETAFAWSAVPKATGALRYWIERIEGIGRIERVRDSAAAPEVVAWLDVEVRPALLPRVLIRAARPSPEAAALRRGLARRGFETQLEIGLGGGTRARMGSPAAGSPVKAPGGELIVVFGPWPAAERAALELEAERRGAGIVASGVEAARSFGGRQGFSPGSNGVDRERATAIHVPGPIPVVLSPLRTGEVRLTKPASDDPLSARWLLLDDEGAPLATAVERAADLPPLVLSVIDTVYRYDLRGEREMSSKLWSVLFEAALPPSSWRCSIDDGPIVAGDPLTVTCFDLEDTDRPPPTVFLETPRGSTLPVALEERSPQSDRSATARGRTASGVVWPGAGLHRLRARHATGEELELSFAARPRADWAAWDHARRRVETQTFLEQRTATSGPGSPSERSRRPLPAPALWAVLVAALGVLWGIERSG